MAEAHRIPKETSGESGGVGVFVKCIAQGTHRCDESLCWVAEAQSEPEGESCGDTDVRPVCIVAWVWCGRHRSARTGSLVWCGLGLGLGLL